MNEKDAVLWLGMLLGGWLTLLIERWVPPGQFLAGCSASFVFCALISNNGGKRS